jgi:hypothetical protein
VKLSLQAAQAFLMPLCGLRDTVFPRVNLGYVIVCDNLDEGALGFPLDLCLLCSARSHDGYAIP